MLMTVMIILVSINRNVALTVAAVEFIPSIATDCKIKAHFFPTSQTSNGLLY